MFSVVQSQTFLKAKSKYASQSKATNEIIGNGAQSNPRVAIFGCWRNICFHCYFLVLFRSFGFYFFWLSRPPFQVSFYPPFSIPIPPPHDRDNWFCLRFLCLWVSLISAQNNVDRTDAEKKYWKRFQSEKTQLLEAHDVFVQEFSSGWGHYTYSQIVVPRPYFFWGGMPSWHDVKFLKCTPLQ